MTPLWARMLVFKAWENEKITEKCAHYFDKLILDNSYKTITLSGSVSLTGMDVSFGGHSIKEEHKNIDSVLADIYIKEANNNLIDYIEKTNYKKAIDTDSKYVIADKYLFEIIGTELPDIETTISRYLRCVENNEVYFCSAYEDTLNKYLYRLLCQKIIDREYYERTIAKLTRIKHNDLNSTVTE